MIGLTISRSSEFLLHRRSGRLTYENKFDLHKKYQEVLGLNVVQSQR